MSRCFGLVGYPVGVGRDSQRLGISENERREALKLEREITGLFWGPRPCSCCRLVHRDVGDQFPIT